MERSAIPPNYLVKFGWHILPAGYSGGIFTYVKGTAMLIPLDIDSTGTEYKCSSEWEVIPTVEPVRLLATMPDGKEWCVGLLGMSTGGIQLEIIRPQLYDRFAIEHKRKLFKNASKYHVPAGSLGGIQVDIAKNTYQLNFTISTEGRHFSFDIVDWMAIPPQQNPQAMVMHIAGQHWLVGYLYINSRRKIELQVVNPTRLDGPVQAA